MNQRNDNGTGLGDGHASGEVSAVSATDMQAVQPRVRLTATRGESAIEELLRFAAIVRRHLLVTVLVFVTAYAAVLVLALRQPKLYRAQATLLVQRSSPNVLQEVQDVYALGTVSPWEFPRYMETQASIVHGREIVGAVIEALSLADDPTFVGVPEDDGERSADAVQTDAVAILQGRISAHQQEDSSLLGLECIDPYPDRAARIVNTLADTYVDYNASIRERVTEEAVRWLEDQVADLQVRVEETEDRLLAFRQHNDFLGASIEEAIDINAETIRSLSDAATEVRLQRLEREARWSGLDQTAEGESVTLIPELVGDPVIQSLRMDLLDIERERADLSARYGEKHPAMDDLDIPEAQVEEMLAAEIASRVQAEQRGIRAMATEEQSIRDSLGQEQQRALELSHRQLEVDRLKRELDQQSGLLEMLQSRHQQARLSRRLQANNVSVLEYAPVPKRPFRPRIALVVLVGAVVGLLLGLAAAMLLDRLDRKIRSRFQLERELGLQVIGVQPMARGEAGEAVGEGGKAHARGDGPIERMAADAPQSVFAECLRTVRTNLMFLSAGRPFRTILVSSASRNDGKTAVAANLALTLAATGKRTVLVDANLRRPRLNEVFDRSGDRGGLTPLLIGEQTLDDSIAPSGYDNLDVLHCGPRPPNPAELLDSSQFDEVLEQLAARYERVVLDSPPLSTVSDAKLLSRHADALVFVVRQDQTNRHVVRQTLRQLRDVPISIFGCVLNGVRVRRSEYREV